MSKIILIAVGVITVFMVKSAFLISSEISNENIYIFIGAITMCLLAIRNYHLSSKNAQSLKSSSLSDLELPMHTRISDVQLTTEQRLKIKLILEADGKIDAIKVLREETGMGLKDSKEFLEKHFSA